MRQQRNSRIGRLARVVVLMLLACGCRPPPMVAAAERGSLSELKQLIAQQARTGSMQRKATVDVARAVLNREIRSATDPDGEGLVELLADCALHVQPALERRQRREDHTAGAALLALVQAGQPLTSAEWTLASRSAIGARRAAAALASNSPERWTVRELLLNDADQQVRRAALKSCIAAPAQLHFETLVNVLRRDPDPLCRQLAARAVGTFGGSEADTVLSDAFDNADQQLRLAIVSGWTRAGAFSSGGARQLIQAARGEPGVVGVLAAADLASGSSDARSLGQARITRSLEFGSVDERPLAIAAADWDHPEQAKLLLRLGLNATAETRVLALGRWLEHPAYRWPAQTWLRAFAEDADTTAIQARTILAAHGDGVAIAALRAQLTYAKWQTRAQAARDLWRLDDWLGFARALADDAPEVRITASCVALALPVDAPK